MNVGKREWSFPFFVGRKGQLLHTRNTKIIYLSAFIVFAQESDGALRYHEILVAGNFFFVCIHYVGVLSCSICTYSKRPRPWAKRTLSLSVRQNLRFIKLAFVFVSSSMTKSYKCNAG